MSLSPDDAFLLLASCRDAERSVPYAVDLIDVKTQKRIARRSLAEGEMPNWVGFDSASQPIMMLNGHFVGLQKDGDQLTERFSVGGDLAPPRSSKALPVATDRARRLLLLSARSEARLLDTTNGRSVATIGRPDQIDADASVQWLATNSPGNAVAVAWSGLPMTVVFQSFANGEQTLVQVSPSNEDLETDNRQFGMWGDIAVSGELLIPIHPTAGSTEGMFCLPIDARSGENGSPLRLAGITNKTALKVTQKGRNRKIYEEFDFGIKVAAADAPGYRIEVRTVNGRYDVAAAQALARELLAAGFRIADGGGVIRLRGTRGKNETIAFGKGKWQSPVYQWSCEQYDENGHLVSRSTSETRIKKSRYQKASTKREFIGGGFVQETTTITLPANYGELAMGESIAKGEGLSLKNVSGKIVIGR